MKLVEKKCPNCGAGLSFNDSDTSVKCEYCNKTYYIEKDEKKSAQLDDAHLGDAYKFLNEVGKPIATGFAFAHIAIVLFFFVVFIIISVIIFSIVRSSAHTSNPIEEELNPPVDSYIESVFETPDDLSEPNYVTAMSQIDSISLEVLHDKSVSQLSSYHMNNKSYTTGDWVSCGSYLLVSKNTSGNLFYDVFKHTYKNTRTGKKVVLYAAVMYNNLELTEDNVVDNTQNGKAYAPSVNLDGDSLNFAWGYESVEKLYNSLIRDKMSQYSLESSNGLYMAETN